MTDLDKAFELISKLKLEDGQYEVTDALIEMANWALSNQWVSVEDELPEKLEGENVSDYVYVTNGNWYDIMRYEFNYKIWLDYANGKHWGITHWMSIPKLKKE